MADRHTGSVRGCSNRGRLFSVQVRGRQERVTVLRCDPSLARSRCHRTSRSHQRAGSVKYRRRWGDIFHLFFFSLPLGKYNVRVAAVGDRRRVTPGEPIHRVGRPRSVSVRPRRHALAGRTEKSGVHECWRSLRHPPTHARHYRLPLLLATPPPERGASSSWWTSAETGAPCTRAPRARDFLAQPAVRYGDGRQSAAVENTARPRHMCFTNTPRAVRAFVARHGLPRVSTSTRVAEPRTSRPGRSVSLARSSRPPGRPRKGGGRGGKKRAYKYSDRLLESTVSTLLVDNTGGGGGSRSARSPRPCLPPPPCARSLSRFSRSRPAIPRRFSRVATSPIAFESSPSPPWNRSVSIKIESVPYLSVSLLLARSSPSRPPCRNVCVSLRFVSFMSNRGIFRSFRSFRLLPRGAKFVSAWSRFDGLLLFLLFLLSSQKLIRVTRAKSNGGAFHAGRARHYEYVVLTDRFANIRSSSAVRIQLFYVLLIYLYLHDFFHNFHLYFRLYVHSLVRKKFLAVIVSLGW